MKPAFEAHRGPLLTVICAGAALLLVPGLLASPSQEGDPPAEGAAMEAGEAQAGGAVALPAGGGEVGLYLGVGSCMGSACHASPRPRPEGEVLGNEYYTWLREDPHEGAFEVLYDPRSRTIAGHLGLARPAHRAPECLACHAVEAAPDEIAGPLRPEDGITCEGCHGPASGWRDGHTDPSWTHADSVRRGLVDLADPSVRAESCLGCHLGDGSRQVDHALLAAGHPQLVFELDNYTQEMPPHWRPRPHTGPGGGAAAWAVGQAVAFREGLAQLGRRAGSGTWPEFSELSCYSCHHSLAGDRWRESGRYRGRVRPGLPPWSPARWVVLRHVVETVAPEAAPDLSRDVAELARAVERMTRPEEVKTIADQAAAALGGVIPRLEAHRWSRDQVQGLLARLAADPALAREGELSGDVHSAEQVFFAAQSLAAHLIAEDPRTAGGPLPRALERLYRSLAEQEGYDRERFLDLLEAVAEARPGPSEAPRQP